MRKLIAEKQTGVRKELGTDWPILDQVHKTGPREWTYTWGLCNGIAEGAQEFKTKREALEYFGEVQS